MDNIDSESCSSTWDFGLDQTEMGGINSYHSLKKVATRISKDIKNLIFIDLMAGYLLPQIG
jgi:hypothetical protein